MFLSAILLNFLWTSLLVQDINFPDGDFQGNVISDKGAWCWFADPRALCFERDDQKQTFIGYIDVHGNIKAFQYDLSKGLSQEVLVRSYFQPDDHNSPTFLALPDGRIMIFYSRHTDEKAFYYRISKHSGDISILGEEKVIITDHNTTYPSPFILSDDPDHIYLAWRGIKWHPTIAKLTLPDENDQVKIVNGPFQIVQSTGARPYAKYFSNGKDKISMAYTTAHPDNQIPNYLYYHYIDINSFTLVDIKNNIVASINEGPHNVSASESYDIENPFAVVDKGYFRNWIWDIAQDENENPVIAMVKISEDKLKHNYYHVQWNGEEWISTFLANGGGSFHQTSGLEQCYSGGMTINYNKSNIVYCSIPIEGAHGKVYEIVKCIINEKAEVSYEPVTWNSSKNNIRPYYIPFSENTQFNLVWMHGHYYDWIVSSTRPQGFPTAIHTNFKFQEEKVNIKKGLLKTNLNKLIKTTLLKNRELIITKDLSLPLTNKKIPYSEFSISLNLSINHQEYGGTLLKTKDFAYSIDKSTHKPFVKYGSEMFYSSNILGTADGWKTAPRATEGHWYEHVKFDFFNLTLSYKKNILRTYINGLLDQTIIIPDLRLDEIVLGGFEGRVRTLFLHKRALNQSEIKKIAAISDIADITAK